MRGLEEAFTAGVPVTAKISWHPNGKPENLRSESRMANATLSPEPGEERGLSSAQQNPNRGQTRWISATPLLGSDDRVGVWMVLIVEKGHYGTIKQRIQSPTPTQEPSAPTHNLPVAATNGIHSTTIGTPGSGERPRERRLLDGTISPGTSESKTRRVLDLSVSHPPKTNHQLHHSATATVLNSEDGFDDFASVTSAAINGVVHNSATGDHGGDGATGHSGSGRPLASSGADSGIGRISDEHSTGLWNPTKGQNETIRIPITNGLNFRSNTTAATNGVTPKPLVTKQDAEAIMRRNKTQASRTESEEMAESLMRVPALAVKRSVTPNDERTFSL